jgi:parallel beta-helix repeat protein
MKLDIRNIMIKDSGVKTSGFLFTVLLLSSFISLKYPMVYSNTYANTIYIRPDGTVDPVSAPIVRKNDTYTLTSNINETIVIERDDIFLDGSGFKIQGEGYSGLSIQQRANVTVRNILVTGFFVGIELQYSNNCVIAYSIITETIFCGVSLQGSSDNVVLQNTVTGGEKGVLLENSHRNMLLNNLITRSANCSVCLDYSHNNTLSRNNAMNSRTGIVISNSNRNVLSDNSVQNNTASGILLRNSGWTKITRNYAKNNGEYGIYLSSSGKSSLSANTMTGNRYNFGVEGTLIQDLDNDVEFTTNIADGKPIYYLRNTKDIVIDGNVHASTIYIVNCTGIVVKNLNLTNNGCGVFVSHTNDIRRENVRTSGDFYGIRLDNCSATVDPISMEFGIFNCSASSNEYGIYLNNCHSLTLGENEAADNELDGIHLYFSTHNLVVDNKVIHNNDGVSLYNSDYNEIAGYDLSSISSKNNVSGIYVERSNGNLVWLSNLTDNGRYGINLLYSSGNIITENIVANNGAGICLRGCDKSTVSWNNVLNNRGELRISIPDPGPQGQGIYTGMSPNTTISNNQVENNLLGIYLFASKNSVVSDNNMSANEYNFGLFSPSSYWNVDISPSNIADGKKILYLKNSSNIVIDSSDVATIYAVDCSNLTIKDVILTNNYYGLYLESTSGSRIENVCASHNYWAGLHLSNCNNLSIAYSTFRDNEFGTYIYKGSSYNKFSHNNYINNTEHWFGYDIQNNNTAQGNYWDTYGGSDADGNGIGETPYEIGFGVQDNYPLIEQWSPSHEFQVNWESRQYQIEILSNSSTITKFSFNQTEKTIQFNVSGPDHSRGYCNVTIPRELLDASSSEWRVSIMGIETVPRIKQNSSYTFISFAYNHSTSTAVLKGTKTIGDITPTLVWTQIWFWALTGLLVSTVIAIPIGIRNYRKFKKQSKIVLEYESELESLPLSHPDRAKSRFIRDVMERNEKIEKFQKLYGIKIRPASAFDEAMDKLGIPKPTRKT